MYFLLAPQNVQVQGKGKTKFYQDCTGFISQVTAWYTQSAFYTEGHKFFISPQLQDLVR